MTLTCPHCQQPIDLLTNEEVGALLCISRARVQQIARARNLGQRIGPQGWRLFSHADVEAMRVKGTAGRPRKNKEI